MDAETRRLLLVGSIQDLTGIDQDMKDSLVKAIELYGTAVRIKENNRIRWAVEDVLNA